MVDTCVKHSFELATDVCRVCRNSYCSECLVYSYGPKKPPYCVTCALAAAGIRRTGAAPKATAPRRGFFGRRHLVEVAAVREPSFDDVQIELPASLVGNTTPIKHTRRRVSEELVEAVNAAEASGKFQSDQTAAQPVSVGAGAASIAGDNEASLADWAASLGEVTDPAVAEAPTSGITPWPEDLSSGSGTSF